MELERRSPPAALEQKQLLDLGFRALGFMVPSKAGFFNLIFIGFKEALVTGIPRVPESYFSKVHIDLATLGSPRFVWSKIVPLQNFRPASESDAAME